MATEKHEDYRFNYSRSTGFSAAGFWPGSCTIIPRQREKTISIRRNVLAIPAVCLGPQQAGTELNVVSGVRQQIVRTSTFTVEEVLSNSSLARTEASTAARAADNLSSVL